MSVHDDVSSCKKKKKTKTNPIPWNDEAGADIDGLQCYDEEDQWKISSSSKRKKQIVNRLRTCKQWVKAEACEF
jgi:hypothetical protein